MGKRREKPELLVPAGSLEALKAAVIYGADAVYIGGEAYGLRARAKNFSMEDMEKGIRFAHDRGTRVYVTANILAHNEDLEAAGAYFKELKTVGPDALIVSDPGIFQVAKSILPDMELHISTQANNTNYGTWRFWHSLGARRVVSARELSLKEIRQIRDHIPDEMEIETFVHGAMCISYSGRCLLSNFLTGRDANRGNCTHPCRWKYAVVEESRPGQYFPVEENDRGTFLFNSKDLCMIGHIPDLFAAGIDSFKIEGRMKAALYAAVTARTYRHAIDDYGADPALYERNLTWYKSEIGKCTTREFTTGFFYGKPTEDMQIYDASTYNQEMVYLGMAGAPEADGFFALEQKNKFCVGETVEIMKPDGRDVSARVLEILDEEGNRQDSAPHARQRLRVRLSAAVQEHDILRKDGKTAAAQEEREQGAR
ncbi:MAG: U32 family peptidase [Lachnospiraceae bacterium]|nr:U32 family peptidase [Lachnospiraceae bacterium]